MKTAFDRALAATLKHEGGYVNDPHDAGGATNHGITESVARSHGYMGDMRDLTVATAAAIYKSDYWDELNLDAIANIDEQLAAELFDTAVNCGAFRSGRWFQMSLNILTGSNALEEDGVIGNRTLTAYKSLSSGDRLRILLMCRTFQGAHYLNLAHQRPTQRRFIRGWLKRV
jgi:lysozyme family protein